MTTLPEVQKRFEQLSKEEKAKLVRVDMETFAPYVEFDGYNFELTVAN
jgi:hypothetical protein